MNLKNEPSSTLGNMKDANAGPASEVPREKVGDIEMKKSGKSSARKKKVIDSDEEEEEASPKQAEV